MIEVTGLKLTESELEAWQSAAGGPVMGVLWKIMQKMLAGAQEVFQNPSANIELLKQGQGILEAVRILDESAQAIAKYSEGENKDGEENVDNEEAVDVDF